VPRPIITRWNAEIRKISHEKWYQDKFMAPLGMSGSNWSAEEFDAFHRGHIRDMAELIRTIGMKAE
jgi:tripartite-type tricarboxylate transporter receptor subunit TctC